MTQSNNQHDPEQALADLISQILDRQTRGDAVDLEAICSEHPEHESGLREMWGTFVVAQVMGDHDLPTVDPVLIDRQSDGIKLPHPWGEYTLIDELGRGGMGVVYRAVRNRDQRQVALKMILQGEFASPADRQRFQAEANAVAKLNHPHIVPIDEIGEHQSNPFFCMKLIEGPSLSQRLAQGPLTNSQAAELVKQISRAIHHAHEQGILHRDLKPSNILLDENGTPCVVDFGLAKHDQDQISLTRTGAVVGTPSYMSPEQASGARGQVNPSSDVYSLGAILYHCLTGHPPFLGTSPIDTLMKVVEQDPVSPRILNPQVDRTLEMIVMRCLQKPQDLRYQTAADLADDLETFQTNGSVSARLGRFGQVIGNVFRETHHAPVLENWGLLWMWHSLVLLVTSLITQLFFWMQVTNRIQYWLMWNVGMSTWATVFWILRHRMGPVTFVERQIAHVWAGSMGCVLLLFPLEYLLDLPVLSLAPLLGALAGVTFLMKAGILSGSFYIHAFVMFATSACMALFPETAMIQFGLASAACFFFAGLKYYRRKLSNTKSQQVSQI